MLGSTVLVLPLFPTFPHMTFIYRRQNRKLPRLNITKFSTWNKKYVFSLYAVLFVRSLKLSAYIKEQWLGEAFRFFHDVFISILFFFYFSTSHESIWLAGDLLSTMLLLTFWWIWRHVFFLHTVLIGIVPTYSTYCTSAVGTLTYARYRYRTLSFLVIGI